MKLSEKFEEALVYATRAHANQTRKKTGIPFVAHILGDTYETPKPPWLERKRAYIEHLKNSDGSTRLVSASDKLHNTRAILAELRRHGLEVFERFAGKKDGTVCYYRTLVTAFRQHGDHSDLIDELDHVVTDIEKFVREH